MENDSAEVTKKEDSPTMSALEMNVLVKNYEDKIKYKAISSRYERIFDVVPTRSMRKTLMFSLEKDLEEGDDSEMFYRGEGGELHESFFKTVSKFHLPSFEKYHVYAFRPAHVGTICDRSQVSSDFFKFEMPYAMQLTKKNINGLTQSLSKIADAAEFKHCYFTSTQAVKILGAGSHLEIIKFKDCLFTSFDENKFGSFLIRTPKIIKFKNCLFGDLEGYEDEETQVEYSTQEMHKVLKTINKCEQIKKYGKEVFVAFQTTEDKEFGMTLSSS